MGDGGGGHWLVRMEWRPAGWSVCLPLLIFPCTIKSRSSLLAPAHPGGPGKRAVKRLWCGGGAFIALTVLVWHLERGREDLHIVQLMPLAPRHVFLNWNPDWSNFFDADLPTLSWKRGPLHGYLSVSVFFVRFWLTVVFLVNVTVSVYCDFWHKLIHCMT